MTIEFALIPIGAFLAMALLVLAVYVSRRDRAVIPDRLQHYRQRPEPVPALPVDDSLLKRPEQRRSLFDWLLRRGELYDQLALDLARAGLPLRVGEYLALRAGLATALALASFLTLRALPFAIVLAGIGFFVPRIFVSMRQQKRVNDFNDQLAEALGLLANSLRSGYSFLQAMEAVTRELPPPISREFRDVIQEMAVGAGAEDALRTLTRRVPSGDLDLVVTAMIIQRRVGGNLGEILDTIGTTIRERLRILREVRTLTAQERTSGYVIGALPIFLMVAISFINRDYVNQLLFTFSGQMMLAVAGVLEVLGFLMIRKIVAIEV